MEEQFMKILYIGSGMSANICKSLDLSKYHIICANNAWRLFENSHFNTWIHTGDFPHESRPKVKNFDLEISYKEYGQSAINIVNRLNIKTKSPAHHLGYTTFFNGLYWIMDNHPECEINLLGFDHDYNPNKIKKWNENAMPNPQNKFLKDKNISIEDWAKSFFEGMRPDSFYGQGTPDPIRLGEKHLIEKFNLAIKYADQLNIKLYNLSPVVSKINTIPKKKNYNE